MRIVPLSQPYPVSSHFSNCYVLKYLRASTVLNVTKSMADYRSLMTGYCENTHENPLGGATKNKKIRDRVHSDGYMKDADSREWVPGFTSFIYKYYNFYYPTFFLLKMCFSCPYHE